MCVRSRATFVQLPNPTKLREMASYLPFLNYLKAVHSRREPPAVTDDSPILRLFRHGIGGNSFSVFFASILDGALSSKETLSLASKFTELPTFPIKNDDRGVGLLSLFRMDIDRLKKDIKHINETKEKELSEKSDGRATELEQRLLKEKLSNAQEHEELQKAVAQLRQVKLKYSECVDEKVQIQEELIGAEEERLKLSETLLSMKLKENELAEEHEKAIFELQQRLLDTENSQEVLEHEKAKAEAKADEMKSNFDTLKMGENSAHAKVSEMEEKYAALRSHTDELSAELLVATNQCEVLENQTREVKAENELFKENMEKIETQMTELKEELEQAIEELKKEKVTSADRLNSLQRAELALESGHVQLLKTNQEELKQKDEDILRLQHSIHEQSVTTEKEMTELKKNLRISEQRSEDMSQRIITAETLREEIQNEMKEIRDRFTIATGEHIKQLESFASNEHDSALLHEVEDMYSERCDELENQLSSSFTECARISEALSFERETHDKLRQMVMELDIFKSGEIVLPTLQPLKTMDKTNENRIQANSGNISSDARIKEIEKRHTESLSRLHSRIKDLESIHQNLTSELAQEKAVSQELRRINSEKEQASITQHQEIQKHHESQKQLQLAPKDIIDHFGPIVKQLRESAALSNDSIREEIQRLTAEIQYLRPPTAPQMGNAGSGSSVTNDIYLTKYKASQKEVLQLKTKLIVAEKQLKAHQNFMRERTVMYQKQITRLKTELAGLVKRN
eukprot:TRINITY_DN3185_c0_g1_i2.p1 TRINITY_DN3185_c0_g1~~TRINITY_DN3185_c0_g1_i2.p1  ORF type:complete len:746 (+),score=244.46 TRINITY_DN3185_c0_g1_i2:348-2585(+)